MLSKIQQAQAFRVAIAKPITDDKERQEMKILNALATVLIINHDVVSVVSNHSDSEKLQVIACARLLDENRLIIPQSPNAINQLWQFIATKNFRRDDPAPATPIITPIIIEPTVPTGLNPNDPEELKRYVDKQWLVHHNNFAAAHTHIIYNRSHPTLSTHIWILSKLLLMPDPHDRLLRHVIATCHRRMIRRIHHPTLSKPYLVSLKAVTAFSFVEPLQHQEPNPAAIESDRLLLSKFLSSAAPKLHTKLPKIEEQIALVKAEQPFKLYTKETCMEFHLLLCELLERFETALAAVLKFRGIGDVPTEGSDDFKVNVVAVLLTGYALQQMARGSAIETHLKTIAPLLRDHRRAQADVGAKAEMSGMETRERDVELEGLQPTVIQFDGAPMPLWRSYRDWLRLMVVHFDAVEILVAYITGPHFNHGPISIKILVSPPVGEAMLPWQTLFKNSDLFPDHIVSSAPDALDALDNASLPTNAGILKFLQDAVSSNPEDALDAAKMAAKAVRFKPNSTHPAFVQAIKKVELLGNSKLPGWRESAAKIILKIENLEATAPASSDRVALVRDITCAVQSLVDSANFYADLKGLQIFKGTLHCEACLASLLALLFNNIKNDSKYEDILKELQVGYAVSMLSLQSDHDFCEYRNVDELLGYRNGAARHVDIYSSSLRKGSTHSL